jgi:hypothetical protein
MSIPFQTAPPHPDEVLKMPENSILEQSDFLGGGQSKEK